jgi:hypothetical protein
MAGGTINVCNFYEDSTYSATTGCLIVNYFKPFYFKNQSSSDWDDTDNWFLDSDFNLPYGVTPSNGDVVYIKVKSVFNKIFPMIKI